MSDATKAKDIQVEFKLDSKKRSPVSLTARLRLNTYPSITMAHHVSKKAESSAVEVTSNDICKEVGQKQKKIFTTRKKGQEDFDVTATVDGGGKLTFKGFSSNPTYNFSAFNVSISDTGVASYSGMDVLNYSIYPAIDDANIRSIKPDLTDKTSLVDIILEVESKIYGNWSEEAYEEKTEDQKHNAIKCHEFNTEFRSYFIELLEASRDTIGWDKIGDYMKELAGLGEKLKERIWTILANASGSFSVVIQQLCSEFQLLYVPEWNKPGKLVNRNKLFDNPENLKLDIVALAMSGGASQGLLPTRFVAVQPVAYDSTNNIRSIDSPTLDYIACPKELQEGGTAIQRRGPLWLPYDAANYNSTAKAPKDGSAPKKKKGPVINAAKEQVQKAADETKKREEVMGNALYEWGMSEYLWLSLASSVASVTIPLDFRIQPGKRYTVQNSKGKPLFSGYLIAITHSVTTESKGQALTTLDFSHIMAGDFKLPGIP